MELLSIDKNSGLYELLVTGNSRLRILNDYEQNLICDDYIEYNGTSLTIFVYNIYEFALNNKFYAKLTYYNKIPRITCLWDYDDFNPSYAIYPIYPIKFNTLKYFNITDNILIDYDELYKNDKILDNEYENYLYFTKSKKSITHETNNKYISNDYTIECDIESDNSVEELCELIDISVFDDLK
jgi:hypothetical protein